MSPSAQTITEADILAHVVHPERGDFPQEIAQTILQLRFEQEALDRLHELAEKNNLGTLTAAERQEMDKYLHVGNFLNLLHAKARLSLQETAR